MKAEIRNVEQRLNDLGLSLPKRCTSPISRDCRPEVDISPELDVKDASCYQSLIGILRLIVELERVSITTEVSMMALCMSLPRKGQLEQLYQTFEYLKLNHNSEMAFDPLEPDLDEETF